MVHIEDVIPTMNVFGCGHAIGDLLQDIKIVGWIFLVPGLMCSIARLAILA